MVLWIILAYILPFVINYVFIREHCKINKKSPDGLDFLLVVVPVFNMVFMIMLILCTNTIGRLSKIFFCYRDEKENK